MADTESYDAQQAPRSDLARTLLALADPIRLRMLSLMSCGSFCPEQLAQVLGVDTKIITKHLVYFRDSKLVTMRSKGNTKYYGICRETAHGRSRLVNLVIELLEEDNTVRADVAISKSQFQEHLNKTACGECEILSRFEVVCPGHSG